MRMARGHSGVTLLELVIALTILVIAVLAFVSSIYQSSMLQQTGRERAVAYNAARSQIEKMRSVPLGEVYARYNANPDDDPGGKGSAPGPQFDIEGLASLPAERVGRVFFPEAGVPPTLREDVRDPAFGMPDGRDLNRDGVIDSSSHARDYRILPVSVVLAWQGVRGRHTLRMDALLTAK